MDAEPVETHELAALIDAAAHGRFPPADGGWTMVRPWRPGLEAVFAFTGHAFLALDADRTSERLAALGVDGFGGAHDPRVVTALAGANGWIDSLDALLVGRGTGGDANPALVARPDLTTHPRTAFAAAVRDDLQVLGQPDRSSTDVVVIARGIGGLLELSFELDPNRRGRGEGATLVRDAMTMQPAGFRPIGSLQLFRRETLG